MATLSLPTKTSTPTNTVVGCTSDTADQVLYCSARTEPYGVDDNADIIDGVGALWTDSKISAVGVNTFDAPISDAYFGFAQEVQGSLSAALGWTEGTWLDVQNYVPAAKRAGFCGQLMLDRHHALDGTSRYIYGFLADWVNSGGNGFSVKDRAGVPSHITIETRNPDGVPQWWNASAVNPAVDIRWRYTAAGVLTMWVDGVSKLFDPLTAFSQPPRIMSFGQYSKSTPTPTGDITVDYVRYYDEELTEAIVTGWAGY